MEADDARAGRRLAVAALAAALLVLLLRFLVVARASLSYDEATYVDLAAHPWRSAFYPDAVFVRHPPLYFFVLAAWTLVAGTAETVVRLPSLLLDGAGIVLTWDALRRLGGHRAATLGGVLLGVNFLTLVYGLQATMYPLAFALAALGLWAHTAARHRTERAALVLLCLTHLFGYVFLGVWLWRRRHAWRAELPTVAAPILWLVVAALAAVVAGNAAGPGLGPTWQVLRVFAIFYEGFVQRGALVVHLLAFLLALLLLNPAVLRSAWTHRLRWSPWAAAAILLTGALLPGPGFLRYALILVPAVLAAGVPSLARSTSFPRVAGATIGLGVLAATASVGFVAAGVDPRAANDLPGRIDWVDVAGRVDSFGVRDVAAPSPTSLAHYLGAFGWTVADASAGPGRLVLVREEASITLRELPAPSAVAGTRADLLVVPTSWTDALQALRAEGATTCAHAPGADLVAPSGAACGAAPLA